MANTFVQIGSTVTVGSGAPTTIDFTSIPNTYTDLILVMSGRLTTSGYDGTPWVVGAISLNGTVIASGKLLFGTGSASGSDGNAQAAFISDTDATANTFSSMSMYLPNYQLSNNKSISVDVVTENNGTASLLGLQAILSTVTSAITSITLTSNGSGAFAQYTTAALYGIKNS
jgi:hypothetical protein